MSAHFTQLFALLYQEGKVDQLAKAVEQARDRMGKAGELDLWHFWKALVLAAQGDFEGSAGVVNQLPSDSAEEARRAIAIERIRQTKDYATAVSIFNERWQATHSPADLLTLCEIQLEAGNPRFVADHARQLVDEIATPAALRIAVTGAFRCDDWKLCYDLLKSRSELFPDGLLPSDLERLRVWSAQSLGLLDEARLGAETLVRGEATSENLSLLFQIHVRSGNLKGALFPARQLVTSPHTSSEVLLHVATVMRLEDPAIAEYALREAVTRGLNNPGLIGQATSIAAQLNSETLMRVLVPKMVEEAGHSNQYIRKATLEDVVKFKQDWDEQTRHALNEWRAGRVPIHFLGRGVNIPLAAWHVIALSHNEDEGTLSPNLPVFFRHGGREAVPTARNIRRLYLDITALHLAHELEILPFVEELYAPLYLPPAARLSLIEQADDADRNQPNVVAGRRAVKDYLDAGRIEVWNPPVLAAGEATERGGLNIEWWQALEAVKQRNGLLIDYWPKLSLETNAFVPTKDILGSVSSVPAIIEALSSAGEIGAHRAEVARTRLNAFDSTGLKFPTPMPGQCIFLEGNLAEQLAQAEILDAAARVFKLIISATSALFLKEEIARQANWQRICSHLKNLRDHVTASTAYRELLLHEAVGTSDQSHLANATERCLTELLQAEPGEGHFVWIDDRLLNGHGKCGEVPIITILGVIAELHRAGKLTTSHYFALRHRLRASDFRYIPSMKDEIVYHVSHASVSNGQIIETPELSVLRRYHARILLDRQPLQIPPLVFKTANPNGEAGLLGGTIVNIAEALREVFTANESDQQMKFARADWILHSLWLEPAHINKILGRTDPITDGGRAKILGDGLLLKYTINRPSFGADQNRNLFSQWLSARLLVGEERSKDAALQIREVLESNIWRRSVGSTEKDAYAAVMQNWYLSLPEKVRKNTDLARPTRDALAIGKRPVITVGTSQFDPKLFWEAAEKAVSGQSATLAALDGPSDFSLSVIRNGTTPVLLISHAQVSSPYGLEDDIFDVLQPGQDQRLSLLASRPEWFDSFGKRSKREMRRIAKTKRASDRASAVDAARRSSAWHHYLVLTKRCLSQQGPSLEDMSPPSQDALTGFLRLPKTLKEGKKFRGEIDRAAERLIDEVGVVEAFHRLALLPCLLPTCVGDAVAALPATEKGAFLDGLPEFCRTPLARIHGFNLLLCFQSEYSAQSKDLVRRILSTEEINETAVMLQMVTWAWDQLGAEEVFDPAIRLALAWTHGGILFGLLRQISKPEDIYRFAHQYDRHVPEETLSAGIGEDDVAFPRSVSPTVLIVTGVAAALRANRENLSNLDSNLIENTEALCFMHSDDIRVPKIEWLQDPNLKTDRLNSFLREPRDEILVSVFGPDDALEFSSQRIFREFETLVASLEADSGKSAAWVLLSALLSRAPYPVVLSERLAAIVKTISWEGTFADDAIRHAAMVALSANAWRLGGREMVKTVERWIGIEAKRFAQIPGDENEWKRRSQNVLLAIQQLSRNSPRFEAASVFSDALITCLDEWPAIANAVPGAVAQLLQLPEQQLAQVWPLILRLRYEMKPQRVISSDD